MISKFFKVVAIGVGCIIFACAVLLSFKKWYLNTQTFISHSLFNAISTRDLNKAQLAIQSGANVNPVSANTSYAPLHLAVIKGYSPVVERLIQSGADVNAASNKISNYKEHITPLHIAAKEGYLSIAQLLIQSGANINALDHDGNTPLHFAAAGGHFSITQLLIQSGANLNVKNKSRLTPLKDVVLSGRANYLNIVRLFILPSASDISLLDLRVQMIAIDQLKSIDIISYMRHNADYRRWVIEFLSWYIYQTVLELDSQKLETYTRRLEHLNDLYQRSVIPVHHLNPLLRWVFEKLLKCKSKKEFIENILTYYQEADEEKRKELIKSMRYFFSQEELLEEFILSFNEFKELFSLDLLENFTSIFRYQYAKELKRKIYGEYHLRFYPNICNLNELKQFSLDLLENFRNVFRYEYEKQKQKPYSKDYQFDPSILNLIEIKARLMNHYNHTKIKSPFINNVIELNQTIRKETIIKLAQAGISTEERSSVAFHTICKADINDNLALIRNIQMHLDYIIQNKGLSFNSSTPLFGTNTGLDIIVSPGN